MIVLGVDPGTRSRVTVWSQRKGPGIDRVRCDSPSAGRLSSTSAEIFEGVLAVVDRTRPDVLCVEGVFYGRTFGPCCAWPGARCRLVGRCGSGRGVAEYPPAEVKSAVVGSGKAAKDQVAFMVQKHLSLVEPPSPSDAADGIALALCHLFRGVPLGAGRAAGGGGVGRKRRD